MQAKIQARERGGGEAHLQEVLRHPLLLQGCYHAVMLGQLCYHLQGVPDRILVSHAGQHVYH